MSTEDITSTPEEIAKNVLDGKIGFSGLITEQKHAVDPTGQKLDIMPYLFAVTDYLGREAMGTEEGNMAAQQRLRYLINEAEALGLCENFVCDGSLRLRLLGLLWDGLDRKEETVLKTNPGCG